ncbi:MAG: WD40 repeat domain-containing protein [Pirellulaceae bacterium]
MCELLGQGTIHVGADASAWFFDIQFSICHRSGCYAQWLIPPEALAQPAPEPVLRIDTGGHSSYVTSLVWNRDGDELLSAGWDKLVRVWRASDTGSFVNLPQRSLRLPIGPGPSGKFDALALSNSGRWLAIGGYASLAAAPLPFETTESSYP